jgi:hypothetical protein
VCTGQSGARSDQGASLGLNQQGPAINHWTIRAERRTVRCANQPTASGDVGLGPMVTWSIGQSGAIHRTVQYQPIRGFAIIALCRVSGVHRIVQCTHGQKATKALQMELQWLQGPWAIKRPPRRMEQHTKHPLNILQHREIATMLLLC